MKKYLRRALPWLVTLLLASFLIRQGGNWRDLQAVLGRAQWFWLLLAMVWQASSYGAVAWLNELLLRHYGASVPWLRQYVIQLAMAFVEAAIPSATVSGFVLRARLLKPYGVSADVATATTLVEIVLITGSVLLFAVLAGGLAVMSGVSGLGMTIQRPLWLIGVIGLAGVALWQWRRGRFDRLGGWIAGRLCRAWDQWIVRRWPDRLAEWPATRLLGRGRYLVTEVASLLRTHPYAIGALLVARTGFEALGLMMCFYALGQPLPLITLLLLYTFTIGVNTLGAVPGGVGLAEVSLATLYTQFGLDPGSAVAVAVTYRLTDYWLPRAAGGLAWLWLERQSAYKIVQEPNP